MRRFGGVKAIRANADTPAQRAESAAGRLGYILVGSGSEDQRLSFIVPSAIVIFWRRMTVVPFLAR
jgi:hypothetical protein